MIRFEEFIYLLVLFIVFLLTLNMVLKVIIDCYHTDLSIEKNYSIKKTKNDVNKRINKANRKCFK